MMTKITDKAPILMLMEENTLVNSRITNNTGKAFDTMLTEQ